MKIEIKPRSLLKPLLIGHLVAYVAWWVIGVIVMAVSGEVEFGEYMRIGVGGTFMFPKTGAVPVWVYAVCGCIISSILMAISAWICTILGLWILHNFLRIKVVGKNK